METAIAHLVVILPLLLTACLLLWWARRTSLVWLRWVLSIHTLFWLVALLLIDAFLIFAIDTCGGTALYGFQNCTHFRASTANYAFPGFLISHAFAIGLTALVILVGGFAELLRIRRKTPPSPE